MNCYIEEVNSKNLRRQAKLFEKSEFIAGYILLIGAYYYCQSNSVLFSTLKEHEESRDTILVNIRFNEYMNLY